MKEPGSATRTPHAERNLRPHQKLPVHEREPTPVTLTPPRTARPQTGELPGPSPPRARALRRSSHIRALRLGKDISCHFRLNLRIWAKRKQYARVTPHKLVVERVVQDTFCLFFFKTFSRTESRARANVQVFAASGVRLKL